MVWAIAEVGFQLKNAAFQWVIDATSGLEIEQAACRASNDV
jgi:hypothetical protein